ncbi:MULTISPECIES: ATP-binding cassette domain-containing protein [unclassified Micromonospora]|uniref:ATP-binding cassette domain-containing protein n=1 Tax=unclassified Micromonospora TaxID=2617518 RepID=UPI003A84FBE5
MAFSCELLGVSKQYGGRDILVSFDLQIKAGEMIAITGPSGTGKSTVLNMFGLLDVPDSGEVRILGGKAPRPSTRAANRLRRRHLGYLFQNFALIDNESVGHNLDLALTYSDGGISKRQRIADALMQVDLPGSEHRKIYSLSGGEQQRVAVARLLLKPCDIVLADEPTGSLDADNRDFVLGLLRRINKAGKTVVLATHDDIVARSCSHVITIAS